MNIIDTWSIFRCLVSDKFVQLITNYGEMFKQMLKKILYQLMLIRYTLLLHSFIFIIYTSMRARAKREITVFMLYALQYESYMHSEQKLRRNKINVYSKTPVLHPLMRKEWTAEFCPIRSCDGSHVFSFALFKFQLNECLCHTMLSTQKTDKYNWK